MLPEEVAPLAYAFLRSPEGAAQRKRFDVVLIDDFQNLSRAEQDCMSVREKPGSRGWQRRAEHGRQHVEPRRLRELRSRARQCAGRRARYNTALPRRAHSSKPCSPRAPSLRSMSAQARSELVKWNTPEDELAGIAELVVHDVKGGIEEKDICIVAPNKLWATTLAKETRQARREINIGRIPNAPGRRPARASRCRALVAWTKLCLLANPSDVVAWRCWCGIGNYLTNSDAWSGLMEFAANNGLELLRPWMRRRRSSRKGEEPFLRASAIAKGACGRPGIHRARAPSRRGFALLKAIGASGLAAFETCEELAEGDEDAPALLAIARESLCAPVFGDDPHLVRIMGYGDMAGLSFERMYATGAVDGYIPSAASFETVSTDQVRMRELERCRRTFCDAVSKGARAARRLVFQQGRPGACRAHICSCAACALAKMAASRS